MAKRRPVLDSADEVFLVPTSELVAASYSPNEAATRRPRARRKGRALREEELGVLEAYGGFERFLVRTAVIRSSDYDPLDAPVINAPHLVWDLLKHLQFADQEHFVVVALDAAMRLRAIHETAVGGSSSAQVELKHVIKVPLLVSATGVIVAHNHPSAEPTFSEEDKAMTKRLKSALDCVGVSFVDAIVVARKGMRSWVDTFGTV